MVPVSYNYRNLVVRWKTTVMTASGFTLVVAALVVMLGFINGIQKVCAISGEAENVIVLAKGNNDEVMSQMDRILVGQVENTTGVATDAKGQPLACRELFMVTNFYSDKAADYRFLQLRGILGPVRQIHTQVKIIEGEMFRPNQSEIAIGKAVQREHGLKVGDTMELGRKPWKISGVFEAKGTAFESEVWADLTELANQFRREGVYSSVVLRAADPAAAQDLAERLASSRSFSAEAMTEPRYYEKQGESTKTLEKSAWVIAWLMGVGAVFGVMNTMFAAIGQRIKDIAVLRIMGFQARDILLSFLLEAVLISLIGGALGLALGYCANGITRSTNVGVHQIDFSFSVDGSTALLAAIFTGAMGVLGGLLPAMSAMRIRPLEALR